ncbi:hypothetical protein BAMA_15640 [Bacillus manliponensis]|uniref:DUF3961 domain-containing protein n=1 Tax=Bacillus manliponensis TaxID=574376 RepID=A0A073JT01_9BACI|nr:hypothetical protein [Bacillus manliponensis]KEK17321.1 hypothetical protein BAMA_15640 [Bacillus manliponensis]
MANTLIKITTNEPILSQKINEKKPMEVFHTYVSNKYQQLNEFFGIEEILSDRAWYYGTLALMFFLPAATYIISELIF